MESIIQLIQENHWEEAELALSEKINKGIYNDTIAVLAATVNEHFGDTESFLLNIETGLKYNHENYELYLMLGNYYADKNVNQAFLCYENAEYYCKKNGNAEDFAFICEMKERMKDLQEMVVKPYSFVILSYNTLKVTELCINSIRSHCNPDTYELIVIDNASTDGSVTWLREQKDIVLIENKENKGFPVGCNQGIMAAAAGNDIMLLNSDTIMMPNAMFALRMGLYASEQNGMVGSVSNHAGNDQDINEIYEKVSEYVRFSSKNNVPRENVYEYKVWLAGFALLLKRSALDSVGLLDERFTPGNYEDNDLGIRFLQKGFRNVLCWNSFIFHWGGKSFDWESSEGSLQTRAEIMMINMEKYKEKWGISPMYYMNARQDLIQLMWHHSQEPIRVLEIGCGAGATLGRIRYCYPDSEVYGIELVEEAANLGAVYFDIICGNVEKMELPYQEKYFDYIILGDVLEHLIWPQDILKKLKGYLREGGCVLASIPNMMNAGVIYDLLQGHFPYEEAGIRDATHLRFFTLEGIVQLFQGAGYEITQMMSVFMEWAVTDQYKDFFDQLLAIDGVADRRQFDTYQYLIRAKG